MAGFYYFLPNVENAALIVDGKLHRETLRSFGLDVVFGDALAVPREVICQRLTDKSALGAGCMLYLKPVAEPKPTHGIYRPQQKWIDFGNHKVGWDPEEPPAAEDLKRERVYASYHIEDNHEGKWFIPIIKSPDPKGGALPVDILFDKGGQPVMKVKRTFQDLWDLSAEIWDDLRRPSEDRHDDFWYIDAALQILSVNYRLGKGEINALHEIGLSILDSERMALICAMAIEFDIVEEFAEKKNGGEPSARLIECLAWCRGRLPEYRPSRGAMFVFMLDENHVQ